MTPDDLKAVIERWRQRAKLYIECETEFGQGAGSAYLIAAKQLEELTERQKEATRGFGR